MQLHFNAHSHTENRFERHTCVPCPTDGDFPEVLRLFRQGNEFSHPGDRITRPSVESGLKYMREVRPSNYEQFQKQHSRDICFFLCRCRFLNFRSAITFPAPRLRRRAQESVRTGLGKVNLSFTLISADLWPFAVDPHRPFRLSNKKKSRQMFGNFSAVCQILVKGFTRGYTCFPNNVVIFELFKVNANISYVYGVGQSNCH